MTAVRAAILTEKQNYPDVRARAFCQPLIASGGKWSASVKVIATGVDAGEYLMMMKLRYA